MSAADLENKQAELDALQKTFDDYAASSKELESELEDALTHAESAAKAANDKRAAADAKIDELQDKLSKLNKALAKTENLNRSGNSGDSDTKLIQLENENENLRGRIRRLEATEEDLEHKLHDAEENVFFLKAELEEKDGKHKAADSEGKSTTDDQSLHVPRSSGAVVAAHFKANIAARPVLNQEFTGERDADGNLISTAADRHPSWLELFFDLAVVLACATLVEDFAGNIEHSDRSYLWASAAIYIMKSIPLICLWRTLSVYYNRFGQLESLADTMLCFIQFTLACWSAMLIGITTERYESGSDVSPSLLRTYQELGSMILISHVVYAMAFLRTSRLVPAAYGFCIVNFLAELSLAVLWAGAVASTLDFWVSIAVGMFAALMEVEKTSFALSVLIPLVKRYLVTDFKYVPLNVTLSAERDGLLLIVALGEIVGAVFARDVKFRSYASVLLIAIQAFLFKFAYFDVFDSIGERVKTHALKCSKSWAMLHYRLFPVLVLGILMSVLYLETINHSEEGEGGHERRFLEAHDEEDDDEETVHTYTRVRQIVYAFSFVMVLLSTYVIGLCHKQYQYLIDMQYVPVYVRTLFMVAAAICMIAAAAARDYDDQEALVGIECGIFATCLFVEFSCKWLLLRSEDIMIKSSNAIAATAAAAAGGGHVTELELLESSNATLRDPSIADPYAGRDSTAEANHSEAAPTSTAANPLHMIGAGNNDAEDADSKRGSAVRRSTLGRPSVTGLMFSRGWDMPAPHALAAAAASAGASNESQCINAMSLANADGCSTSLVQRRIEKRLARGAAAADNNDGNLAYGI